MASRPSEMPWEIRSTRLMYCASDRIVNPSMLVCRARRISLTEART